MYYAFNIKWIKNSRGLGIDICNKAISVAKINLETMNLNKGNLKCRSIDKIYNKKFDLIVSIHRI